MTTCPAPTTRNKGAICGRKCIAGRDTCGMHTPEHRARGVTVRATEARMAGTRRKKPKVEWSTSSDCRCLRCEATMEGPDDQLCQGCTWETLATIAPLDFHPLAGSLVAIAAGGRMVGVALAVSPEGLEPRNRYGRPQRSLIVSLGTWASVQGIRRLPRLAAPSPSP